MAVPKIGETIDGWKLIERKGQGGNAWVFSARRDIEVYALKILKSQRVQSEPYERFRRETETLKRIGPRPGVLPLIDSSLPANPSDEARAWFSMPLADELAPVLADAELSEIVTAVRAVARTLAELRAEHQIGHRDIKPENLYWYGRQAAVGDFGLVALPDQERLTLPGKKIGPANFIAYEMLIGDADADVGPADVFSLAKTLWVFATNARWPPPGHQAVGSSPSIGGFRPHPHAAALDELVDSATRLPPLQRPSMAEFADELDTWLSLPEPTQPLLDLAALGAELRNATAGQTAEAGATERRHRAANELMEQLHARLEEVNRILFESLPNGGSGDDAGMLTRMLQSTDALGQPAVELRYFVGSTFTEVAEFLPKKFRYGGVIELLSDHTFVVRTGLYIGNDKEMGASAWQSEPRSVPVESIAAPTLVDEAADELIALVPEWARRFAGL